MQERELLNIGHHKDSYMIIYAAINWPMGIGYPVYLAKDVNVSSKSTTINTNQVSLEGITYMNFINAIKSPATKAAYETSLKRYLNHIKKTETDDLLVNISNPRYIESQIIGYIMSP